MLDNMRRNRRNKIHIYISLCAALVMTVVCIVLNTSLADSALRLIVTIILFYIIGLIAEDYIKQKIFPVIENAGSDENAKNLPDDIDSQNNTDDNTSLNDYDYADNAMHEDDYE